MYLLFGSQMNYLKTYYQLIDFRKHTPPREYFEKHHIIPQCMGGSDESENIVKLTAREHYLAHALLYRKYRTTKLANAWFCMVNRVGTGQKRLYTSRQYEAARLAHSDGMKFSMAGEGNHFFGKTHTDEFKRLISEKNSGHDYWYRRSEESRQKYLDAVRRPKTEEHKKKIGRKGLIMLKNRITDEVIRIPKENRDNYDKKIWANPFKVSMERKNKKNED